MLGGESGPNAAQASEASPRPASTGVRTVTDSAAAAAVVAAMHRVYAAFKTQDTAAGNAEVSATGMVYVDYRWTTVGAPSAHGFGARSDWTRTFRY